MVDFIQTGERMVGIGDKGVGQLFSMMESHARKSISTLSYQTRRNLLSSVGLPTGIRNTHYDI